ncbi:MAG: glycoside hydrolase family 99-like domain-containing protein [Burkholderiales bacterium]|nr:glycoside hydrolase family 99-like domain-containing protein [Burkholderiales bacterium]
MSYKSMVVGCIMATLCALLVTWMLIPDAPQLSLPVESAGSQPALSAHKIGVFYYPGWRDDTPLSPSRQPWEVIKPYPEREPLAGWYRDGDPQVMQQQINWMHQAGLNFVVFDWYWKNDNRVYLDHALEAYLAAPNRNSLEFSILWANHFDTPDSLETFDRMVDVWIQRYLSHPGFLRVNGKPVVFVFSSHELDKDAAKFGSSGASLLMRAEERARREGLKGIYFVAGTPSDEPGAARWAGAGSGYSAISAYNLHTLPGAAHSSHSYEELDQAYRSNWKRYQSFGSLPVIVPMSSGWDNRPWGGSKWDPAHDQSVSTPDAFEAHLRAGLDAMTLSAGGASLGVICCWNEFGEGSFIEPTKLHGTAYIDRVRKVFSPANHN